jgi:carbonic anhydrase
MPGLLLVNKWLMSLKDLYRRNHHEIMSLQTQRERIGRLAEMNVIQQVENLAHSPIIQDAWRHRNAPSLHGWVYGLRDGRLRELIQMQPGTAVHPIFGQSSAETELPPSPY